MTREEELLEEVEELLEKSWGKIDYSSTLFPFHYTDYYQEEMGRDLKKKFLSFQRLISPEEIVEIKLFSNSVEGKYMFQGKRRINLDPGYVNYDQVVLVSTKMSPHRIYMGKGIYGEVTLYFYQGHFHAFPWTYPDYKEHIKVFEEMRSIFKQEVKKFVREG